MSSHPIAHECAPTARAHGPALLLAAVLAAACASVGDRHAASAADRAGRGDRLSAEERRRVEVFRRACPSVVHIDTFEVRRGLAGGDVLEIPTGMGSGFVWDEAGHVVTNLHVVRGAAEARVSLKGGQSWTARVMGSDPNRDVAVLMIDAPSEVLTPVSLGSEHALRVGQTVLAIGNPFGLDHTLTAGVVSAMGREVRAASGSTLRGMIQVDAAINPGNSGGPLLDSTGELVGMNTALASPTGAFAGIGFAVPAEALHDSVTRILAGISAQRSTIGIRTASPAWLAELGLSGALVLEVVRGGPADRAGLRPTRMIAPGRLELGDLIVSVGGAAVTSGEDFARALSKWAPGDRVSVAARRGAEEIQLVVDVEAEQHAWSTP